MSALTIPENYRAGLVKLVRLTETQSSELLSALRDAPLKFFRTDLQRWLGERIASINSGDVGAITRSLWSIALVRSRADVPLADFLGDLSDAAISAKLIEEGEERALLVLRVGEALEASSLAIPPKARALMAEGTSFCRARIVTDIRPVFASDETVEAPPAAVIVHNLTLNYHVGTALRNLTIALDPSDVDELIAMLGRAKQKQERLAAFLANTSVTYLGSE
jgi:hypothetical protein